MKRLTLLLLVTALVLSCSKNTPPVIETLVAEPDSVYPGDTVTLSFKVSDIDGDGIAYLFHKPAGTWIMDIGTSRPAQWIAPKEPGEYYLTLTISDLTDKVADSVKVHVMDTSRVFTDSRDEHQYKWVRIGKQVWMAENLSFLPSVAPVTDGSTPGKHYFVPGYWGRIVLEAKEIAHYKVYGVMYNWEAALSACPGGWHLPSDEEWIELELYLGMHETEVIYTGWRNTGQVGGKLKQKGNDFWNTPNSDATNSTGFTALPAGWIGRDGSSVGPGSDAMFWSSSPDSLLDVWYRRLWSYWSKVERAGINQRNSLSVRCVKDE
ncbi:MAG: FISUMP domain-containing protein [Bacteroidales bacterium]|jgi:uncharacterized protein (TIGR02145 family)